tara:strand:+ start:205 stop:930 length:726 start_codon:yes stop_codon:yes gene_type:complete
MKKKILIFIPAFNVGRKIYSVIDRIPKSIFLKDNIEILIINDFSTDNTLSEIKKILIDFDYNIKIHNTKSQLQYGGVQKFAFNYSLKNSYEYVIMLHGDGQYAPEELPRFIKEFDNKRIDAVFGSRMKSYGDALKGGMPIYKFLGNIFLTFIQNVILNSKISEFHSGYRSYKVSSLKRLNYEKFATYYHFDTEIIIEILKKNLNLIEIFIPTYYGDEISHLKSIPYGFKVLFTTIKSKFQK